MVNRLVARLLDGLFPAQCALCGLPSQRSLPLCADCEKSLIPNNHPCQRCGLPLPAVEDSSPITGRECGNCQQRPPAFSATITPWIYERSLATLITRWKYQRDRRLTALMTYLLLRSAPQDIPGIIMPVPLNWRRQWWRGFNQSALLARGLYRQHPVSIQTASSLGIRCRRNSAEQAQAQLGARQRAALSAGSFTVAGRCDNLHVTIIDDVLTTGATAHALATALRNAGARRVTVWCIARTPAPGSHF